MRSMAPPLSSRMQNVGEQGHMSLLGHSLAAYISVLERERLRKLTTRILSDTTLWLCRLFRFENGSAYYHEDDRDGLLKVCRLVIHTRYDDYTTDGFVALSSRQPVIYQSAACRPGLGQHLCSQLGLPLSCLCSVPCNTMFGSQHQMDVALLDRLIKDDVDSGKLPLLLIANAGQCGTHDRQQLYIMFSRRFKGTVEQHDAAGDVVIRAAALCLKDPGTPGAGHTDKLGRLKELCVQYGMWLHVEGVNLATLVLGYVTSSVLAATKADSMTLTPGPWLGLPAVPAVTLYRHEDPALSLAAGLTSSQPVEKLRALPLWLSLQYLGHDGIVERIKHASQLSQKLLDHLKKLTYIKTTVEDELNSPVVVFRFSQEASAASSRCSAEGSFGWERELQDSLNRWLGEQLAQQVPASGVDVVELEDEGSCVRFNPLMTAAVLGTQESDVQALVEKLAEVVPLLSSTLRLREEFREEVYRHTSLGYIEDLSWPGLGVVRYEPRAEELDDSRRQLEVEKVNSELLKKLNELDSDLSFSTGPEFGPEKNCVFVGMATEDLDVAELVNTIASLGRDIEESSKCSLGVPVTSSSSFQLLENMTEVVRRGILEAELELQKANEEKLMEEGVLRQIPLVGSVLNWFSPSQSSIKGRTFNLAAGSLDSTESTYSTKAQAGRETPPTTPTFSVAQRLPGVFPRQRLFRRSAGGHDTLSETSSVGLAEELSLKDCSRNMSTAENSIELSQMSRQESPTPAESTQGEGDNDTEGQSQVDKASEAADSLR
ncbi:pyridoxal-dependent decarboxylase domain-containing protein 1-like [Scleropages formosus]|uniref:Pyridoxal-dependent decarboxylase domain-containing protein 1 n=1 Tax=Scleropages formosus TaxID=113540 RepID=A0A0P7TZ91_SCLFO|nr:pyridoxal-dependent decarboxylase domain-containing protein 1-like [Scleropages formosus]